MPDGLFSTVADLAKAGFAGVGVVIFLLLFVLLMRGKPIDAASAKLYNRMLTWGVSFAAFCGVLSIVSLLLQPKPVAAGPTKLLMTFAPDFDTEKLPAPRIKLSDGQVVKPDQEFIWPGGMINVSVGDAFNQIKALKQTVGDYGKAIESLRGERDALAKSATAAAAPAASASIDAASQQSAVLQSQVKGAIAAGQFDRAAVLSKKLSTEHVMLPPAVATMVRDR